MKNLVFGHKEQKMKSVILLSVLAILLVEQSLAISGKGIHMIIMD